MKKNIFAALLNWIEGIGVTSYLHPKRNLRYCGVTDGRIAMRSDFSRVASDLRNATIQYQKQNITDGEED